MSEGKTSRVKQSGKKKRVPFRMSSGFWKKQWLPALVLIVACLGIYIQSVGYEFVLDDQIVISDNNFTKSGISGIKKIFTTEGFTGYFGEQKNLVSGARYRPLSLAMFALEYEAFGLEPMGYHVINVLLYVLLCLMLFRVAHIYFPKWKSPHVLLGFAFLSSLLYAVHPVHTECVANVKGRDEILAMIGSVGVLYMVAKYLTTKRVVWIALMKTIFLLALLAKENSLTFLAVVALMMYFFTDAKRKDYLMIVGGLLGATAGYLIIRYAVIGYFLSSGVEITDVMNNPFVEMNVGQKFATIFYTLGEYLRLLSFPLVLTHDYYPYHVPIMEWSDLGSILSLLAYIVLGGIGLYGLFKKKFYGFCIAYYIATLSIVSNLVFPIGTFMNERFLFMPSWGYCLLLVYLLVIWLPRRFPDGQDMMKKVGYGLIAAFAIFFLVRSAVRVPIWNTPLTLNQAAIKVSKNSARANVFIGTALYKDALAMDDRAEKERILRETAGYFQKAVDILPRYLNANKMKAGAAAQIFNIDNDADAMLAAFKDVASRRPDVGYIHEYCDYLYKRGRHVQKLTDFFYDVGYNVLYKNPDTRNLTWSQTYLNYGLQMNPNEPRILYAMYLWHNSTQRTTQAQEYLRRAQAIDPNIASRF